VISCRRCPRLVRWREQVAGEKVRRFAGENYWGRPVPGFGDPEAALLLVGLAPAAHGGNRTGRVFTGDESGRWLFRALYRAGFANQPESVSIDDGLVLSGCYVSAAVRCAPPANKPLPAEFRRCAPYLLEELRLLRQVRVIIGLGRIGFRAVVDALSTSGRIQLRRRPAFAHGTCHHLGEITLLGSYHPSQQNTFTGRLTEPMFDEVFARARRELEGKGRSGGGR
jgi:uracil-DNA glycosylase family 4